MKARGARGGAGGACCRCGGERGGGGGGGRGALLAGALLLYCGAGAALFRALEGAAPAASTAPPAEDLRARCVERLWALTEDLNILYRDNWTALAARELRDFQRALVTSQRTPPPATLPWTFAGSFLYALTLVTTIGPGGAPRSAGGKLAAALYAAGGMPLVLLYLAAAGGALARVVRRAWASIRHVRTPPPAPAPSPARTPFQAALNLRVLRARGDDQARCERVPPLVPLLLLAIYVLLGGLLFRVTERWSLAEGCYFSFSSLATIGLGALRPGRGGAAGGDVACAAAAAYIVIGIALVAAAFELLRGELRAARRPPAAPAEGENLVAVSLVT